MGVSFEYSAFRIDFQRIINRHTKTCYNSLKGQILYYTIYKVINKITGKYYIGKHQTENLNDGYMGSGKLLKKAIKKHGIENFTKEILFIFGSEKEMNDKEKELVIVSEETYNLCPGGHGGFGYINNNKLGISSEKSKIMSDAWKTKPNYKEQKINATIKGGNNTFKNKKGIFSKEYLSTPNPRKGVSLTEETKEKISKANKGKVPWNKGVSGTKYNKN